MEQRRQPEIVAGRVNSDGTIATGDGFTVNKTATGRYTITLGPGFRVVSVTAISTGFFYWIVNQNYSGNTFEIMVSSAAAGGTLVDSGFNFIVVGVQQ